MSKLITTDEQLRAHLPNIVGTVKGETPFIERLSLFLDLAEDWVINTFVSTSTFNTICGYTDANPIKVLTARLIVADAMLRAIPSLDVILTPNGMAVVNTSNLAPASTARVDRLTASMVAHRDDCISALLPELVGASKWLVSDRATFFGATLFPDLGIVDAVGGATGAKWDKYVELRVKVIDLEASLAEDWLSPELMEALRDRNLRGTLSLPESRVVNLTKAQIVGYLKDGTFSSRRLADIVNFIRCRPDDFPLWHGSKTSEQFSPPVFRNRKEAGGYFF